MKRSFFVLIISLFVLLTFAKLSPSFAQENVVETDTPIGQENLATQSAPSTQKINYELPFPGMLPDNPFYFLKVIRDAIVKALINDDLKRARFSLESGEKRMYAGKLLVDKNKDKLAVETIAKSNNYLEDAINAIKKYSKNNPKSTDVKPFLSVFDTVVLKHLEIAGEIKPSIDAGYEKSFENEHERMKRIERVVRNMLNAK